MYVALVGVEIWVERDEIEIVDNADTTMNNFLEYRRNCISPKYSNDNAQLITCVYFSAFSLVLSPSFSFLFCWSLKNLRTKCRVDLSFKSSKVNTGLISMCLHSTCDCDHIRCFHTYVAYLASASQSLASALQIFFGLGLGLIGSGLGLGLGLAYAGLINIPALS